MLETGAFEWNMGSHQAGSGRAVGTELFFVSHLTCRRPPMGVA